MAITVEQFTQVTKKHLPLAASLGFVVEELDAGECVARAVYRDDYLRPGGTISGPVMMALADFAMFGAIMSRAGHLQLALTTSLNINFLIRPQPGDIVAVARLFKFGKRLAVGEVDLTGNAGKDLVAHVTCTYSLPPPQAVLAETD